MTHEAPVARLFLATATDREGKRWTFHVAAMSEAEAIARVRANLPLIERFRDASIVVLEVPGGII